MRFHAEVSMPTAENTNNFWNLRCGKPRVTPTGSRQGPGGFYPGLPQILKEGDLCLPNFAVL
ncbi:MAG: hypothetical protein DME38_11080 [Verrucomicrobia bacterium]|nr:MAG: hypothetical protein DME38_11080 [Verrucomicrobiota bacterium]